MIIRTMHHNDIKITGNVKCALQVTTTHVHVLMSYFDDDFLLGECDLDLLLERECLRLSGDRQKTRQKVGDVN